MIPNEENPKNEDESVNEEPKIIFLENGWTKNFYIDWEPDTSGISKSIDRDSETPAL
jgi:hypothetical protein